MARAPVAGRSHDRDHAAIGLAYAHGVVTGEIPACAWVRKACQRSLDDLARWDGGEDAPYRFDRALANKFARFLETLPHVKGPLGGERLRLAAWQSWLTTTVFGWVHNAPGEARDGKRRFRRVYIEVPRGNGKSALSSGVALACLTIDGEAGASCFSFGSSRDQARIVFRDAQQMARKSPQLMAALGVEVLAHTITVARTGSRFEAMASESHTLDGLSVHFGCMDEAHSYRDRGLYEVVETATAKRLQSLLWVITTAGSDRSGICYELRTFVTKVLDGLVQAEEQFGVIYTIDDDDRWQDPPAWVKANPNWAVSVQPDVIEQLAQKAIQLPSAQPGFLLKHLNVWHQGDTRWLPADAWARCGDPTLSLDDFQGQECVVALDLAARSDIAAKVYLFGRDVEGVRHHYLFGRYYLPEAALSDGRNASYAGWEIEGRLVATPGDVTDFGQIEAEVLEDASRFQVREIAYDPWQAENMAQRLQANGASVIEYRATVQNFSAPMKELAALVLQGRLHHDGCPVLAWMVSNVVCHLDAKDNIYPRKERPENKIDGVVAAIMALGRVMAEQDGPSVYEDRGVLVL